MVDWKRVNDLRTEIGEEDFGEILTAFLEETDAMIAALRRVESRAEMASMLHFLKGSALNIGLSSFVEACRQAEAELALGKSAPELDHLHSIYRETRAALVWALMPAAT